MALKLRRGTDAQRLLLAGPTAPAQGELIFTTDTKKLYVGDGSTPGGIPVDTGGSGGGILLTDLSIGPENSASGDGSISYNNTTGVFTYTPPIIPNNLSDLNDVSSTIPITNQVLKFNGSSWAPANDTGITDIVQDTSPQLGGNLDCNGHSIVSTSNGNIIINPDGTGAVLLNSGDVVIGSNSKSGKLTIINSDNAINSFQYFYCGSNILDPSDGSNFVFRRSRGTFNSPTVVEQNDDIVDIFFQAFDGTAYRTMAKIGAYIDGLVSNNLVPGSLTFSVHDTTTPGTAGLNEILALTTDGFLKTNKITSKTTNSNLELTANGTGKITLSSLIWPSSDGTNGQVLTTNGAGSLSWSTVSGGGSTQSSTHNVATLSGTTNWGDGTAISVNDNNNTQYISFTNTLGGQGRATLPNITTIGKIVILSTTSTDGTNVDKYKFPGNAQSNAIVGNNASGLIVLLSLGSGGWKLISQITD